MNLNTEDVYRLWKKYEGGNRINKIIKKILYLLCFIVLNLSLLINSVKAVNNITSTNVVYGGNCGNLLKYKGIVVKVTYVEHIQDGLSFPAYCLDKNKPGVSENFSYSVFVDNSIKDIKLWRIIMNGYPYKSVEQLGCCSKEEAFTATKQAIYCYIYGNNINDYEPIGEAGLRTFNALKQIFISAESSTENQSSSSINIIKEQEDFVVDNIYKNYVSKIYSIKTQASFNKYSIQLEKSNCEFIEDIKITDINNNEKSEFLSNERFKILIPINDLTSEGSFKIRVKTSINSKPILYGKAFSSSYQDYALTTYMYEDITGELQEDYACNNTKLKIIKQDSDSKQRLENVEFSIFDQNKDLVYSNLKTDTNGEVNLLNLIPGSYFLKETNTKQGYILNDDFVKFDILYNQELILQVDNSTEKVHKENISNKIIKKLPVTGM